MRLILLFALSSAMNVNGQNHHGMIQIHILDTVLVASVIDQKISIQLDCKSESDSTFLLYGINGGLRNFPIKVEDLCDYEEKMSAGTALYIYDSSMKKMGSKAPLISKDINYKPLPAEKLDSIVSISRSKYIMNTRVIKGFATIRLMKEIDLKEYDLEKGTYYIQVVYFSGKLVSRMLTLERIARDKEVYKAEVYRGCTISNRIMFVVN